MQLGEDLGRAECACFDHLFRRGKASGFASTSSRTDGPRRAVARTPDQRPHRGRQRHENQ